MPRKRGQCGGGAELEDGERTVQDSTANKTNNNNQKKLFLREFTANRQKYCVHLVQVHFHFFR